MKKKLTKTAFKSSAVAIALALGAGGAGANVAFASSEGGEEGNTVNLQEIAASVYNSGIMTLDAKTTEEIDLVKIYVAEPTTTGSYSTGVSAYNASSSTDVYFVFSNTVELASDLSTDDSKSLKIELESDTENITDSDKTCAIEIKKANANTSNIETIGIDDNETILKVTFAEAIENPENIAKIKITCTSSGEELKVNGTALDSTGVGTEYTVSEGLEIAQ